MLIHYWALANTSLNTGLDYHTEYFGGLEQHSPVKYQN